MVVINKNKCIGCGLCKGDCFANSIEISDGKACFIEDSNCMSCGHCIAVCPENAISLSDYDMGEVLDYKDISKDLSPEIYLNHLKSRRTIRSFKDTKVSKEQMDMILDAGRYSPTGGNSQNVVYHVFRDKVPQLRQMILDELKDMGLAAGDRGDTSTWYYDFWVKMHETFEKDKNDLLFFDANTVIAVSSDSPQSGIIASAHMETMIYSLGLGMLYSGFSTRAISHSEKIQKFLGLKDDYSVWTVMVIGTPAVSYLRTVPRKKAEVLWD